MATRYRERSRRACSAGKIELIYNGVVYSTTTGYAGSTWHQTCDDTTMLPPFTDPHPLVIMDRDAGQPMRINGIEPYAPLPILKYYYTDYNPPVRSGSSYCPAITPVNFAYWQTKALAGLNPGVPLVDLPLFIFEFKDLPAMLKNLGEVLLKRAPNAQAIANAGLAYSFGWKPLISDLRTLWNLTQKVEERDRYLRKLEHGTYIRRKLGGGVVQHSTASNGFEVPASDGGYIIRADVEILEKQKAWFTANAKLLSPPLPASSRHRTLMNEALGLNVSPATMWNMIPWSWLIDYFANFSDFMSSQRGNYVISIPTMCVMVRSEITSSLKNVRIRSDFSMTGGSLLRTVAKQRNVVYQPVPWLTLDPILSGTQILNLGTLITAKALGSPSRLGK